MESAYATTCKIPHLHDSLVYYKQADSYRRASTKNQTADKGLQAARYHRPGARGQPYHAGYRESGGLLPPQWKWEQQIQTPTEPKDIPNLSTSALAEGEGCQHKWLQTKRMKAKTRGSQGKMLSFLEAFHHQLLSLLDSQVLQSNPGIDKWEMTCLMPGKAFQNVLTLVKMHPYPYLLFLSCTGWPSTSKVTLPSHQQWPFSLCCYSPSAHDK